VTVGNQMFYHWRGIERWNVRTNCLQRRSSGSNVQRWAEKIMIFICLMSVQMFQRFCCYLTEKNSISIANTYYLMLFREIITVFTATNGKVWVKCRILQCQSTWHIHLIEFRSVCITTKQMLIFNIWGHIINSRQKGNFMINIQKFHVLPKQRI
jgi:hypothetical protein